MPCFPSAPETDDGDKVANSSPNERSLSLKEAQIAPNGSCGQSRNYKDGNRSNTSPQLRKATAAVSSDRDPEYRTNRRLLGTAFVTFITFALIELGFSFVAGSKAMLGDAAAMIVDSISYLLNGAAERRKSRYDELHPDDSVNSDAEADPVRAAHVRQREKRKTILQLEIIPPVFSVTILFILTVVIIKGSVDVFLRPSRVEPNIYLMMGFSLSNLVLDLVNLCCFAKARHLTGYAMKEDATVEEEEEDADGICELAANSSGPAAEGHYCEGGSVNKNPDGAAFEDNHQGKRSDEGVLITTLHGSSNSGEDGEYDDRDDEHSNHAVLGVVGPDHDGDLQKDHNTKQQRANLNMCSAYTHVFADTLRSIAVIIAAGLSMIFPGEIQPAAADATAALVVSGLILLSLMPLTQSIWSNVTKLRAVLVEERSERPLCD